MGGPPPMQAPKRTRNKGSLLTPSVPKAQLKAEFRAGYGRPRFTDLP